jgi:Raf kinase inhibitor-like YbhB/YbcL family protein
VLTLDDPDVVGTFHHLVAWNIDPATTEIVDGMLSDGAIIGVNSTGKVGYIPPCPPNGRHRYMYTLVALDRLLDLPESANRNALDVAMAGHILAKSELTATFTAK